MGQTLKEAERAALVVACAVGKSAREVAASLGIALSTLRIKAKKLGIVVPDGRNSVGQEDARRIREGYSDGATVAELSERFGRHRRTVQKVLRADGPFSDLTDIFRRTGARPLRPELLQAIYDDYAGGMSKVEVAKKHGVSRSSVYLIVSGERGLPDIHRSTKCKR